jgi:two-component system sensor histidine kinase YesM
MLGIISHISWNSIRFKLVVGLLCITVPLITLLIYTNYYSIHVVHNQVAVSNKNMMSLYMKQIDNQLDDVDKHVVSLAATDLDIQTFGAPESDTAYQLAKTSLNNKLSSDILSKPVDSFFVFSIPKDDLLDVFRSSITYSERTLLRDYLHSYLRSDPDYAGNHGNRWFAQKIGQSFYFFRILQIGDIYIGTWVNAGKLLTPLNFINLGKTGAALFVSDRGEPLSSTNMLPDGKIELHQGLQQYYMTGDKNDILVVGESSRMGDFSLYAVIPDDQILQHLPYLTHIITAISLGSIALLPLSLWFLRKTVLVPLKRILATMRRIGDGHVSVRIEPFSTSDEFRMVNDTFNKMMSQIEDLKINVYEEQLSKQKAELQHLQLQINPHFFMNSLNILFNLARMKNFDLIQEMTLCLMQYFRYMFRSNLSFVTLRDEIKHIQNYLRIQKLRFPRTLTCSISAPDFLSETQIPPLVIQTFVENVIKHAITMDDPIELTLDIDLDETALEPKLKVVIRDTGKGFSEEVLDEIHKGNRIIDEHGDHIGIWNVSQRLKLLYGDKARIVCYNGFPQGAVVEMTLPLEPPEQKRG